MKRTRAEVERIKRQILADCKAHDQLERRIMMNARKLSDRTLRRMGLACGG